MKQMKANQPIYAGASIQEPTGDASIATASAPRAAPRALTPAEMFLQNAQAMVDLERQQAATAQPANGKGHDRPEVGQALAEARALVYQLGQDHPKAMLAMIDAIMLADPGYFHTALAECGITLPAPTHVDDAGQPLISSHDVAASLGVPHQQVLRGVEQLGEEVRVSPVTDARLLH